MKRVRHRKRERKVEGERGGGGGGIQCHKSPGRVLFHIIFLELLVV